jgi:hypothetical protein
LPVRLGLLNSQGSQDLIVNILATQRYEVANYPNVKVATNIRVQDGVRNDFASFYEALFSRVIEKNPKAVVTEYAWASNSCDPCPTPALDQQDLLTLGGDVLQPEQQQSSNSQAPAISPNLYGMTLTRLHARYSKNGLGEDLVFAQAPAIVGGRGLPGRDGSLDQNVTEMPGGNYNSFQGRYVILHPWAGELSCQDPIRGDWGGDPNGNFGSRPMTQSSANGALTGLAPKAGDLNALLAESVPSLSAVAQNPLAPLPPPSGSAGSIAKPAAGGGVAPVAGRSAPSTDPKASATAGIAPTVSAPAGNGKEAPSSIHDSAAPRKSGLGCSVALGAVDDLRFALAALAATLVTLMRRRRSRRELSV